MITLDEIAPYPEREEDVTAEAMAKHYTAFAQMHHRRIALILHSDNSEWIKSIGFVTAHYGIVYLLRELEERAGAKQADEVAKRLWADWEDGSGLGERLWEWLTEYGVDPEAVNKVAAEIHAAEQAKAAQAEQSPTTGGA